MPAEPDTPSVALVIGASGAIGRAIAQQLAGDERFGTVLAFSRSANTLGPGITCGHIDLDDEASITEAARFAASHGTIRMIFVATGILQDGDTRPEKSMRALDPVHLARYFSVNTIGPALVARHFLPLLPRTGLATFAALSARVGSIEDNRLGGWYGYRASKAALNQVIRTLAIELARTRPEALCVALHPGTVESALSAPFRRREEGSALFTPDIAAAHLLHVLNGLDPSNSGGLFAWDGQSIPF